MPAFSLRVLNHSCGVNAFGRSLISTVEPSGAKRTWIRTFCGSIVSSFKSDAGAEAHQFDSDILAARLLAGAGEPRLGADADDGIEPLVFLAGDLGQPLASFLHVDMAGSAFGLSLAFVKDAHLG